MRAITKKYTSVQDGKTRFAQVTVAALKPEEEKYRVKSPELFLNNFRINSLSPKDQALVEVAMQAVRDAEESLGWSGSPLCVTRVESSFSNQDPEAAGLAATSAATALINETE